MYNSFGKGFCQEDLTWPPFRCFVRIFAYLGNGFIKNSSLPGCARTRQHHAVTLGKWQSLPCKFIIWIAVYAFDMHPLNPLDILIDECPCQVLYDSLNLIMNSVGRAPSDLYLHCLWKMRGWTRSPRAHTGHQSLCCLLQITSQRHPWSCVRTYCLIPISATDRPGGGHFDSGWTQRFLPSADKLRSVGTWEGVGNKDLTLRSSLPEQMRHDGSLCPAVCLVLWTVPRVVSGTWWMHMRNLQRECEMGLLPSPPV